MLRRLTPRSLERAQWYSDLIIALGEAEKLLVILERDGGFAVETAKLRKRVETLRIEVTQLNRVILGEGRILPGDWPAVGKGGH
ncbi:MAG TPA: hypothetical protein VFO12_10335 [Sphingomicrobium sp.]|nr:hypothetical protein [Sphingomicrobium sp.]